MIIATTGIAADASGSIGAWTLAWVTGLICGIVMMVLATVGWRDLPARILTWMRLQRRNAGWAILGAASLAVLAFY